jgi:hypothetical protein
MKFQKFQKKKKDENGWLSMLIKMNNTSIQLTKQKLFFSAN